MIDCARGLGKDEAGHRDEAHHRCVVEGLTTHDLYNENQKQIAAFCKTNTLQIIKKLTSESTLGHALAGSKKGLHSRGCFWIAEVLQRYKSELS